MAAKKRRDRRQRANDERKKEARDANGMARGKMQKEESKMANGYCRMQMAEGSRRQIALCDRVQKAEEGGITQNAEGGRRQAAGVE
jgi:hypothetical protein